MSVNLFTHDVFCKVKEQLPNAEVKTQGWFFGSRSVKVIVDQEEREFDLDQIIEEVFDELNQNNVNSKDWNDLSAAVKNLKNMYVKNQTLFERLFYSIFPSKIDELENNIAKNTKSLLPENDIPTTSNETIKKTILPTNLSNKVLIEIASLKKKLKEVELDSGESATEKFCIAYVTDTLNKVDKDKAKKNIEIGVQEHKYFTTYSNGHYDYDPTKTREQNQGSETRKQTAFETSKQNYRDAKYELKNLMYKCDLEYDTN